MCSFLFLARSARSRDRIYSLDLAYTYVILPNSLQVGPVRTLWGAGRERVWGLCWDGAGAGGIGCGYGYGYGYDMKISRLDCRF